MYAICWRDVTDDDDDDDNAVMQCHTKHTEDSRNTLDVSTRSNSPAAESSNANATRMIDKEYSSPKFGNSALI